MCTVILLRENEATCMMAVGGWRLNALERDHLLDASRGVAAGGWRFKTSKQVRTAGWSLHPNARPCLHPLHVHARKAPGSRLTQAHTMATYTAPMVQIAAAAMAVLVL